MKGPQGHDKNRHKIQELMYSPVFYPGSPLSHLFKDLLYSHVLLVFSCACVDSFLLTPLRQHHRQHHLDPILFAPCRPRALPPRTPSPAQGAAKRAAPLAGR